MSKRSKQAVALPSEPRPSRIRRDPVRIERAPEPAPPSPQRDIRVAIAGVAAVAVACAALVVGLSQVTSPRVAAAASAPATERFGYCRNGGGPNCVIDGDTFALGGMKVGIAGIDAPEIHPSSCADEARLGVEAAVRLHRLLNAGEVTLAGSGSERDDDGGLLRKVEVGGVDVANAMLTAGAARELVGERRSWC